MTLCKSATNSTNGQNAEAQSACPAAFQRGAAHNCIAPGLCHILHVSALPPVLNITVLMLKYCCRGSAKGRGTGAAAAAGAVAATAEDTAGLLLAARTQQQKQLLSAAESAFCHTYSTMQICQWLQNNNLLQQ